MPMRGGVNGKGHLFRCLLPFEQGLPSSLHLGFVDSINVLEISLGIILFFLTK